MNPGGLLRVLGLNAVPVGGVMLAGWSTGTGLALYWCETLLGTATNAVRIALHRRMTGKRGHYRGQLGVEINAGDDPPARRPARGRTQWRSFLTEYLVGSLVFTFAHGLFLAIILGAFIKSWPAKGDLLYGEWTMLEDCPTSLVDRLRHYFLTYKGIPGGAPPKVEIAEVYGVEEAQRVISLSLEDYDDLVRETKTNGKPTTP